MSYLSGFTPIIVPEDISPISADNTLENSIAQLMNVCPHEDCLQGYIGDHPSDMLAVRI